jgi:hypothetical protein
MMEVRDREVTYTLSRPITFSHAGKLLECSQILLREPTSQHAQYYMRIKQMLVKAQMDMQRAVEGRGDQQLPDHLQPVGGSKINADQDDPIENILNDTEMMKNFISIAMFQSDRVDMGDFHDAFSRIITANTDTAIATCINDDDDIPTRRVKLGDWTKMHPDDQIDMAITWSANFSMPSLLSSLVSGQQSG